MASADSGQNRPRKGYPEKRRAILDASRKVFGRVGYQGASIDMIAGEASVSTRTIYNHFENKEQLFATVLIESSEQVAAAHEAMIERCLGGTSSAAGLEADLVALAMDWVRPRPEFTDHFAIVARINAEGENFPGDLHDAWQKAGPLRVQRTLAARMARLAERGLLQVQDSELAAQHFVVLVTNTWGRDRAGVDALSDAETHDIAAAGVHAFLYGYLPRGAR
ncbi:TetR/AcrR family transcriptional regulator [Streptomyces sp. uw30]|uniref:TetR/AcrR family transcriptional regulator n=1 Tax=Streptomyces sp. uw30 TaxID=1828179 RepID=UPI0011CDD829|nr:TetR/AcrR family transcriptional regulator [Streptomyces sp. uw30]TXS53730.1 TetR/AcrR family transcriptional regulator [Streptomyces sp. uw30]